MKTPALAILLLLCPVSGFVSCVDTAPTPTATTASTSSKSDDERMAWWREARLGLFIHWGLYAIPAGEWKGSTRHAEWIRHTAQIPIERYDEFVGQFNPTAFDADEWVKEAKNAGMKYIVITSKHHDGFCLFDSKHTDYDVMSTPFKRDIMKELADACRRHGLRICWYHSIMDWHHPDYLPRRKWEKRSAEGADLDRYVDHLSAQVTELLSNYGDIGVMWFDGEWEKTWNHGYGQPLYDLCRRLQPNVIVNNRVDTGRAGMAGMTESSESAGDFGTPEQRIPKTGLPGVDWETCMTMNRHWGYNKNDQEWKSEEDLIRKLVDIASKGGNFLLNIGPTAKGRFPKPSIDRLQAIGRWMKVNSEAIYGNSASPFADLSWGRCTMAKEGKGKGKGKGTRLYLHVFDWPDSGRLVLPGLGSEPLAAQLLADGRALAVRRDEGSVTIELASEMPDPICTVVALDIKGDVVVYETPRIEAVSKVLVRSLEVQLLTRSRDLDLRYTLDGSQPTGSSKRYEGPLRIDDSTVVKARSFYQGRAVSEIAEARFERVVPAAAQTEGTKAGLRSERFEGKWNKLPDFELLERSDTWISPTVGLKKGKTKEYYGLRLLGTLRVPKDDVYVFSLVSDDGSRLLVARRCVVDNDGLHGANGKRGTIALAAGAHAIEVLYFNKTGGAALRLEYAPVGEALRPVPASALRH